MPDVRLPARGSVIASCTDISKRWIWLPMDDGSGASLRDLAGEINGNGTGSSIFTSNAVALSGTPVGGEWTGETGSFAPNGQSYYAVANANLWNMCSLSSLTGTIWFSVRIKLPANCSTTARIFDARYGQALYGGWAVTLGTARKISLVYLPVGGVDQTAVETDTLDGIEDPSLQDGVWHSWAVAITRSGSEAIAVGFLDGAAYAIAVLTGTLPGVNTSQTIGVLCNRNGTANRTGLGAAGNTILNSMMLFRDDTPWTLEKASRCALEQFANPRRPPSAFWE